MGNEQVGLPMDLNAENPAKKHQEQNDVQDPSKRSFLRTMADGAMAVAAMSAGVKVIEKVHEAYGAASKKKEDELKKENSVASQIEEKLDFISKELSKISGEMSPSPVGVGIINRSEKASDFKEQLAFLKKEGKKFRAGEQTIPLDLIFSKLEELEKEVSLEVLKVKHGM
jgi:hypothetical protein